MRRRTRIAANDVVWAMSFRMRQGSMTGGYGSAQPNCHNPRAGDLGGLVQPAGAKARRTASGSRAITRR